MYNFNPLEKYQFTSITYWRQISSALQSTEVHEAFHDLYKIWKW